MDGAFIHPRVLEGAMTAMRNREMQLVAHQKIGITSIERAIEHSRKSQQTSGFAACDVVIAGYQQTLVQLNAIIPTALPLPKLPIFLPMAETNNSVASPSASHANP